MTKFEEKNNDAERIIVDLKNQLSGIQKGWKQSRTTTQENRARIRKAQRWIDLA